MPYPTEIAARINDPAKYKTMRRQNDKMGPGIHAIFGILPDGKTELQALRFDAGKFNVAQVQAWLKKHNIIPHKIEAAAKMSEEEFASLADIYTDDQYEDVDGIEILNVYPNTKGIKFTAQDFDEFISNFEQYKEEKTPHIKIDHTSQQAILKALTGIEFEEGTELPNLGLVKRMYHDGKSLFADFTRVPSRLKQWIFGGKIFKAVSPEATWNFRGMGKKVITAISMTNNPSQKHILDVHMTDSTNDAGDRVSGDGRAICFSGDIFIEEENSMSEENKDKNATAQDKSSAQASEDIKSFSEKILSGIKDMIGRKEDKGHAGDEPTIALSEYRELEGKFKDLAAVVNDLKLSLINKETEQKNFSEQLAAIQNQTRAEKAEAICKQALMDGIPTVVVNHFKPILLSEMGEQTIKLSEVVDGKTVEAEKPMVDLIKGFFKIYPDKVKFDDRMRTQIEEPGDDEEAQLSEIEKRKTELMAQGMQEHDALEKAGLEILNKKKGR